MIFCTTGIYVWITGPVPVEFLWISMNFFLVRQVYDSILEICLLHRKFICRTLGEESTCVESTSNKSCPWAPTTNLRHKTGNVLQLQSFGQLGKCCEKCGSMGCFASDFPAFLLHVNAATTFSERRIQVVQSLVCTYIYFSFPPPPLHWARLRALGLTWLDLVSICGQRNIYPNIGNLQIRLPYLMTIVG